MSGLSKLNGSELPSGYFNGSCTPTSLTVPSQIYWRTKALLLSGSKSNPNLPMAGDDFKASSGPFRILNTARKAAPTSANPTIVKVSQRFRQNMDNKSTKKYTAAINPSKGPRLPLI